MNWRNWSALDTDKLTYLFQTTDATPPTDHFHISIINYYLEYFNNNFPYRLLLYIQKFLQNHNRRLH